MLNIEPGRYFVNTADHINLYRYRVKIPAYVFSQPDEYTTGEIDTIYAPLNPTAMCPTMSTINKLLQLYISRTPFVIINDKDAIAIFHWLDKYLEWARGFVEMGDRTAIAYCRSMLEFRSMYYRKIFLRVLNKNPVWKKAYAGSDGSLVDILSLFPSLNGLSSRNLDPIKSLARPPYIIPDDPTPARDPKTGLVVYPVFTSDVAQEGRLISPSENLDAYA